MLLTNTVGHQLAATLQTARRNSLELYPETCTHSITHSCSLTHSPWRTCPALCSPIHRSNWRQHTSWPLPWPNPCRSPFCQCPQVLQVRRPSIISKRPSKFCRWELEKSMFTILYYICTYGKLLYKVGSCTEAKHVFNICFFSTFSHFSRLPCRLKNCHLWVFFVPGHCSSYTLYPLNDCDKKRFKVIYYRVVKRDAIKCVYINAYQRGGTANITGYSSVPTVG